MRFDVLLKMKDLVLLVTILLVGQLCGETLHICRAYESEVPGTRKMELSWEGEDGEKHRETLWVNKEVIVTEKDITHASLYEAHVGTLAVRVNEKAGQRMATATKGLRLGRGRVAVLLDGKLISAPAIASPISTDFIVMGLDHLNDLELTKLAARLQQSGAEAQKTDKAEQDMGRDAE